MQRSNSISMKKIVITPPPPLDKKPQKLPKPSSKLTHWPSNAEERKKLYNKYCASKERLSYQFLELMIRGEDIFKGVTKQIFKRAYVRADEIAFSQTAATHGTITRRKFPYFLRYLLYFTDLWKVFDKMDNDKTTKLTLDKFTRNRGALEKDMSKQRGEEIYREMDKDGGGSVGFDDFCNWLLRQPKVLHYDNQKFFIVDFSNANEDEDPGDIDITPKNQETKEKMKEEEEEVEEEEKEIDFLRARIKELEEEVNNLTRELFEGRNGESNKEQKELNGEWERRMEELKKDFEGKVIDYENKYKMLAENESELRNVTISKQSNENEQTENELEDLKRNFKKLLEESASKEHNLKSEFHKKQIESNQIEDELRKKIKKLNDELVQKEKYFNEKEMKINSEWEEKLGKLKINFESKINEQENKYTLLSETDSELRKFIEKQAKENEQQMTEMKRFLQESTARENTLKSELDKFLGLSPVN